MRFSRSASYNNPYEMFPSTSKLFSGFTSLAENVANVKEGAGAAKVTTAAATAASTAVMGGGPQKSQTVVTQLSTLSEEDDQHQSGKRYEIGGKRTRKEDVQSCPSTYFVGNEVFQLWL